MDASESTSDGSKDLGHHLEKKHGGTHEDQVADLPSEEGTLNGLDRDIEMEAESGTANKDAAVADPNIISWGPDDPEHPYNWPRWKMLLNFSCVACLAFLTPFASCEHPPN